MYNKNMGSPEIVKSVPDNIDLSQEELERKKDPVFEGVSILNELTVLKGHESTGKAQKDMLPPINETIKDLQELQKKENSDKIQICLTRLIAERTRIEEIKIEN